MLRLYVIWAAVLAGLYTWGTMPAHYKTVTFTVGKGDKDGLSIIRKGEQPIPSKWLALPSSNNIEDRR